MATTVSGNPTIQALQDKYFRDGGAETDRAQIYTVYENVSAMREEFRGAGVPRSAIRWDRGNKVFLLDGSAVTDKNAAQVTLLMGRYGKGSDGEVAWKDERAAKDRENEDLRGVLRSEVVQNGLAVDMRSHKEGVIEAALVDAGQTPEMAAVVARETVALGERYQRSGELDGALGPTDDELLAQAAASIDADLEAVLGRHKEEDLQAADRAAALERERKDFVLSYIEGARVSTLADGVEPAPFPELGPDVYSVNALAGDGSSQRWDFRFGVNSATATAVALVGEDRLFDERVQKARELFQPYFGRFKREQPEVRIARDPADPHGMKMSFSEDSQKAQAWELKFKQGPFKRKPSAEIAEIRCNGQEVSEQAIFMAGAEGGPTLERVAGRLDTSPARQVLAVLTVPMSERAEFDRVKAETGAVTRYDKNADSGFGKPGGWYLLKGDPKDFSKWSTAEAFAKFVEEGNDRFRRAKVLEDVARVAGAQEKGHPYGHFARGVMMPAKEEDRGKFVDGYKDPRGIVRRGLSQANAEELRDLARITSASYIEYDRRESSIRLEVVVQRSEHWKQRYDNIPGTHAEKIAALLPREAADGKMGFMGLNHGPNRASWTVDGVEAGLPEIDKRTMLSLKRGFDYLQDRYAVVAGRPLDISLKGVKLAEYVEKREVSAETAVVASRPSEAAKNALANRLFGGRSAGVGRE